MVTGLRNYIVHEYYQVANTVIWNVVTHNLPELENQIISNLEEQ